MWSSTSTRRLASARAMIAAATSLRMAPRARASYTLPAISTWPVMDLSSTVQVNTAPSLHRRFFATTPDAEAKPTKRLEFQAATQKLLHIVANSLYSEKEVFLRELVSNASDALEKLRHAQLADGTISSELANAVLEIRITTNEIADTLTITDTGIGMTEEELIRNLGTIAHSGSKEYLTQLQGDSSNTAKENIIGQFGVGFYSAFMIADKITVTSRSARGSHPGYRWTSDGAGSYEITELDHSVPYGTSIEIKLKQDCKEFCKRFTIESIIQKYSNFVGFPILLNGSKINTLPPLWTLNKDKVTKDQHIEFYRFLTHAFDEPRYTLHFATDAPINLRALLYVPERNPEVPALGRTDPGINLYARKVLIQAKVQALLPEWLRFLKGACDSEDIPLNLSREMLQDSALIRKLRTVLTGRVLRWFEDEAKRDEAVFQDFVAEYGQYLREGCWLESEHKERIAKLLRFPTAAELTLPTSTRANDAENAAPATEPPSKTSVTSLSGYVDRMKPYQKAIYYLVAPSRESTLESPYYEPFKLRGLEVLTLVDVRDEMVFVSLGKFADKSFVRIDSDQVDLPDDTKDANKPMAALSDADAEALVTWMKTALGDAVIDVKVSKRLVSYPAVITGHESATDAAFRKMDPRLRGALKDLPKNHKLEINPGHPIIVALSKAKEQAPEVAKTVAHQLLNNALIGAGVLEDPRQMLQNVNRLMEAALSVSK